MDEEEVLFTYPNSQFGNSVIVSEPCYVYHRTYDGCELEHTEDSPHCWCSPLVMPVSMHDNYEGGELERMLHSALH